MNFISLLFKMYFELQNIFKTIFEVHQNVSQLQTKFTCTQKMFSLILHEMLSDLQKSRIQQHKNIFLRDRKKHTVSCVASTYSAVLSCGGYPSPGWGGTPVPSNGLPQSWL